MMWIALTEGWLSIVAHRDKPDHLLVRARNPSHIRRTFGEQVMYTDADADYPFSADVPRGAVIDFLIRRLESMTYDNFKGSIEDANYHGVCLDVWRTMWAYGSRY